MGVWGEDNSPAGKGVFGRANAGSGIAYGVYGQTMSASGGRGVYGEATATSGGVTGVWGHVSSTTDDATGVFGEAVASTGASQGIFGLTSSTTDGASGAFGWSTATTGNTFGVKGVTASQSHHTAGVVGQDGSGSPPIQSIPFDNNASAGVLGLSDANIGVEGDTGVGGVGVRGRTIYTDGNFGPEGFLGYGNYGVYSIGDYGGIGAKYFVEPHATDPSKVVRFVALEGNESGTYFRGSARTVNGTAVILVPEEFRMVTDEVGLTVQLTPIGTLATMCVVSEDLKQIVVKLDRDVRFHYQVNGIRRAYKDYVPIVEGQEFMPYSPSAVTLSSYPAEIQRRLIANGTYNADGTVNMETARRLGWDKILEKKTKGAAAANAATNAAKLSETK